MENTLIFKRLDLIKKVLFTLVFALMISTLIGFSSSAFAADPLVIEVTVPANTEFVLPLAGISSTTSVQWENGGTAEIVVDNYPRHLYTSAGTYRITVEGTVSQFGYVSSEEKPTKPTSSDTNYYTFCNYLTKLVSWGELGCNRYGFSHCYNLEGAIPSPSANTFASISTASVENSWAEYYPPNDVVGGFNNLFYHCEKITSIPGDLFANVSSNVKNYTQIFGYCKSLTTIPSNLFSNAVGAQSFRNCFEYCTSIQSIPANLFANCPDVWDFYGTFLGCTSITTVPSGLFDNNTQAANFMATFADCINLKTIPMDLFKNNTVVDVFNNCFYFCLSLESEITPELFATNEQLHLPSINDYYVNFDPLEEMFAICPNITTVSLDMCSIGEHMFYGDNRLVNITLGSNVTYMGPYAFYCCNPGAISDLIETRFGSEAVAERKNVLTSTQINTLKNLYSADNYEGYYNTDESSYSADHLLNTNWTLNYTTTGSSVYNVFDPNGNEDRKWYHDNRGYTEQVEITVAGGPYVYNGNSRYPQVTFTKGSNSVVVDEDAGTTSVEAFGVTYTLVFADNVHSGTGTVTVKIGNDVQKINKASTTGGVGLDKYEFQITPLEITVKADDKEKYYKMPDPTFTYGEPTGQVAGETPAFSGVIGRQSTSEAVAFYSGDIVQKTLALTDNATGNFKASDYTLTFVPGNFEIKELDITKESGDPDPDPEPGNPAEDYRIEITSDYEQPYNGGEHKPEPVVKLIPIDITDTGAKVEGTPITLVKDTDYTLAWDRNVNAGDKSLGKDAAPIIIVTGVNPSVIRETKIPFTITKVDLVITPNNSGKEQGENEPDLSAIGETEQGLVTYQGVEEKPNYNGKAWQRESGENPGEYEIHRGTAPSEADLRTPVANEQTKFNPNNYNITYGTGVFTITAPAVVEIIVSGGPYDYDGGPHYPIVTIGGTQVPAPTNNEPTTTVTVGGKTYVVTYEDYIHAGEGTVTVTLNDVPQVLKDPTGQTYPESYPFTINPLVITVQADDKEKYYKMPDPTFTYGEPTGQVAGETPAFSGAIGRQSTSEAVAFYSGDIVQKTLALTDNATGNFKASDYTLTFVPGNFEIKELDITKESGDPDPDPEPGNPAEDYRIEITSDYEQPYNGGEHKPEPVVKLIPIDITETGAKVEGQPITLVKDTDYTLDWIRNVNAGDKSLGEDAAPIIIVTGVNPSVIRETKIPFTITKVDLVITPNNSGKEQGENEPDLSAIGETEQGLVTYDGTIETPNYVGYWQRNAGEEVGEYEIHRGTTPTESKPLRTPTRNEQTKFNPNNYNITYGTGVFTITAPEVVDIIVSGGPYDYDGGPHYPTVTIGGTQVPAPTNNEPTTTITVGGKTYVVTYEDYIHAGEGTVTVTLNNVPQELKDPTGQRYPESYPFTINPREIRVVINDIEKMYMATDPAYTYQEPTGAVNGETPAFTGSLERKGTNENVGTQEDEIIQGSLALTDNPTGNFLASDYTLVVVPGDLTIKPIDLSDVNPDPSGDPDNPPPPIPDDPDDPTEYTGTIVVICDREYTYDGTDKLPEPIVIYTPINGDGTIGTPITLQKDEDYELSYENNLNAKDKSDTNPPTVKVTKKGDNTINYAEIPFTIKKVPMKVTPDNKTKFYKTPDPEFTKQASGMVGTETPNYTGALTRDAGENVGVNYTIKQGTLKVADNTTSGFLASNYDVTYETGILTIIPIDITKESGDPVIPDPIPGCPAEDYRIEITLDYEGPYDGTEHNPEPVVKLIPIDVSDDGTTVTEGTPITLVPGTDYTLDWDRNIDAKDKNDDNPPVVIITGKTPNVIKTTDIPFTITPIEMVIKADNKTKQQGENDPAFTHRETGVLAGETPAFEGTLTRVSGEEIDTAYDILQGTLVAKENGKFKPSNYTITYQKGTLTILPPDVVIVVPDITVEGGPYTYDDTPHYPTVTIGDTIVPEGATEITVDGIPFTIEYNDNVDAGTGTVVVKVNDVPQPVNGGDENYPFEIKPLIIPVDWGIREFVYDGLEKMPSGEAVRGVLPGHTIVLTITTPKVDAGEGYPAHAVIKEVIGSKATNYSLDPDTVDTTFIITPVSIPDEDQGIEPGTKPDDPDPDVPPTNPTGKIKIYVDNEYIYDGTDKQPIPVVVFINGNGEEVPLVEGKDYIKSYRDNINASETDPTIIITGTGPNFINVVEKPFIIRPLVVPVEWSPRRFRYDKKEHIAGGKATKGVVPGEKLVLELTGHKIEVGKDYPCHAELVAVEGGRANVNNYTLDPATVDSTFEIYKDTGGGGGGTPSTPDIEVAIYLSNGSPKEHKGNENYYLLGEEVIYYVDYENIKDSFTNSTKLTLELPLNFEVMDADGGKVDSKNRIITWTISGGLKKNETGRRTVSLKYTAFSKAGLEYEDIYPIDRIYVSNKEKDNASVHNIIYTLDADISTDHIIYMYGDEEKPTFRPDDVINRAEGALVLTRIFEIKTDDVVIKGNEFTDIEDTYLKAQQAIVKSAELGLIAGYEDGSYRPRAKMTRAEFMSIIARFVEYKSKEEGRPGMTIKEVNNDTKLFKKSGHWADKYVLLLARLNMTPEDITTKEDLNRQILRCEVAQLCNMYLMRAPVYDDGDIVLPFRDVDSSHRLFGDIVEVTRPSHHDYRLNEDAYEIWER